MLSRADNPTLGVEYSEIRIPYEDYLGTGEFTTMVAAKALKKINPVVSNVMNDPYFLMIVTINLGINQVTALLGKTHDEGPICRIVFDIPSDIDLERANDFTVVFNEWDITDIKLNGAPMHKAG